MRTRASVAACGTGSSSIRAARSGRGSRWSRSSSRPFGTLSLVAAALLVSGTVLASPRASREPLPSFAPVVVGRLPDGPTVAAARRLPAYLDALPGSGLPVLRRPAVPAVPPPHLIVEVRDPGGHPRVHRGVASWYCGHGSACTRGYPGGLYAAAGPLLRKSLGVWRGKHVVVRANGRAVAVTLSDWCACPHGRPLDLYSDAFERLAPLSKGLVKVSVTW